LRGRSAAASRESSCAWAQLRPIAVVQSVQDVCQPGLLKGTAFYDRNGVLPAPVAAAVSC
jgi:hypothetical protein